MALPRVHDIAHCEMLMNDPKFQLERVRQPVSDFASFGDAEK
jgi:hypothetical protein